MQKTAMRKQNYGTMLKNVPITYINFFVCLKYWRKCDWVSQHQAEQDTVCKTNTFQVNLVTPKK